MNRLAGVICAATLLLAASARCEQPQTSPAIAHSGIETIPSIRVAPSDDLLRSFSPVDPVAHNIGGRVILRCLSLTDGTLSACQVVSEAPAGAGFGAAAIRVARFVPAFPASRDGMAIEKPVRLEMNFPPPRPDR